MNIVKNPRKLLITSLILSIPFIIISIALVLDWPSLAAFDTNVTQWIQSLESSALNVFSLI